MDSHENPEEILQPEGATEIFEQEVFESPEQEVLDLIFPAERTLAVNVYAYVSRVTGKPVIKMVTDRTSPDLKEAGFEEYEIRSLWTIPTAAQMDEYRQECSVYQMDAQALMVNNLAIRDLIVANHLKELLLPPKYEPFPFRYVRPNRLSGDTVKRVKLMHSGIYDKLYTEFVSDSCLIV